MFEGLNSRQLASIYVIKDERIEYLRDLIKQIEKTQLDVYNAAIRQISIQEFFDLVTECENYFKDA